MVARGGLLRRIPEMKQGKNCNIAIDIMLALTMDKHSKRLLWNLLVLANLPCHPTGHPDAEGKKIIRICMGISITN